MTAPAEEEEAGSSGSQEAGSDAPPAEQPLTRHFRFEHGGQGGQDESGSPAVTEVSTSASEDGEGGEDAAGAACAAGAGDSGHKGPQDFQAALARRRSQLAASAQTFESQPAPSSADASFLEGVAFDAPPVKEWLLKFEEPEEDRRAEFFSDGLKRRGPVPAHCPLSKGKEAVRMKALVEELAALKRQVVADRAERAVLKQKEQELALKEKALEKERAQQQEREAALRDYPRPSWLSTLEGTMNVGVVGNSGVGKSLLINRLRGLQAGQTGWAPVGVRETTKLVSMYAFPCSPIVRLWDFPGAGTALFPLETYISKMGLRYLDMVIIVTAGRFTETEIALMEELTRHSVPFLMVRTKVDIDVWNNRQDNNLEEKQTLHQILSDLKKNCTSAQPYLVSLRDIAAYDFPKMLSDVFPCLQQSRTNIHAGWDDAWALPAVYSPTVTTIQGRWHDGGFAMYVQGLEVHVTPDGGSAGVQPLTESDGKVWWLGCWWIDEKAAQKARVTSELRWVPADMNVAKPWIWRWRD